MVAPHELKNKEFTKVMRGYNIAEVDDHIDFIIAQYTELYRQNAELERRLASMKAQMSELQGNEESINGALVDAQRTAQKTVREANEQAEIVMRAAKTNCDKLVAKFKTDIEAQRAELNALRAATREFKASMFEAYRTHIEYLEQLSPGELADDTEDYTRVVVGMIKDDIVNAAENSVDDADDEYEEQAAPAEEAAMPEPELESETDIAPTEVEGDYIAAEPTANVDDDYIEVKGDMGYEPSFEAAAGEDIAFAETSEAAADDELHIDELERQLGSETSYDDEQTLPSDDALDFDNTQFADDVDMPYLGEDEEQYVEAAADVQAFDADAMFADDNTPYADDNAQLVAPASDLDDIAFDDVPSAEPYDDSDDGQQAIYSRQSQPIGRQNARFAPQPKPSLGERRSQLTSQPAQTMQSTQRAQTMPAARTNVPQSRGQVQSAGTALPTAANTAPAGGRTRTQRTSVKDAIRQLNSSFVTEDDDDDMTYAQPSSGADRRMSDTERKNGGRR